MGDFKIKSISKPIWYLIILTNFCNPFKMSSTRTRFAHCHCKINKLQQNELLKCPLRLYIWLFDKLFLMKLLLSIAFSDLSYEIDFLFGFKIYILLLILNYVHKYLQNNKRALFHFVSLHKNYFQIKPCNRSIIYRKLQ